MKRKISSSFTEFYKVYGICALILFILFFGRSFSSLSFVSICMFLFIFFTLFTAFDFWRMKEVEMTGAGLIISERFFFTQKTIFVPFEKIEAVKNTARWLGTNKKVSIKFTGNTTFGKEIFFLSKGFASIKQSEIVGELNRLAIRSKNPNGLNPVPRLFGN